MIVDDEYFNIKSLQLILNKFHSHCDFAFNGQECIRKCLEKSKKPCRQCQNNGYVVFFLDLNMPIMDGFYTVKNLKGMMRDNVIPKGVCIANTGYADLESK
jgi:CheY-like chemotaxis protein